MLRVIGVPVDSVGIATTSPVGTERSPSVLRAAGLIDALGATDAGDLAVRIAGTARDDASGVVGWPDVAAMSVAVRGAVIDALHAGDLPVVIGGCCSVLPAALAGARDCVGVVGLAYTDGHLDLYDGSTSPTGEAADMPIAVVTGLGPEPWVDLLDAPLSPAASIVLLGPRDREDARSHGSALPEELGLASELDPDDIRDRGASRTGVDSEQLITTAAEAFWLHLDVDVLTTTAMPATDYLQPGGLDWSELSDLLVPLGRSAGLVGFSIGCFNPDKDDDGQAAQALVGLLAAVLTDDPA